MKLNSLYNLAGSKKTKKRICRVIGSGVGKTGGRGVKGQKARKGVAIKGFEGGQMPLIFRLPKRGFNTPFPSKYFPLNLDVVKKLINSQRIERDQLIDNNLLVELNIIKNADIKVKVLGSNHIATPVRFSFHAYSQTARDAIEKSECKIL